MKEYYAKRHERSGRKWAGLYFLSNTKAVKSRNHKLLKLQACLLPKEDEQLTFARHVICAFQNFHFVPLVLNEMKKKNTMSIYTNIKLTLGKGYYGQNSFKQLYSILQ